MKKRLTFFPVLIVCALVLSVFSPAMAKPLPPENKLPDPMVTWVTGDNEFTTTFLSTVQLPGTSGADAYLPLGDWPEGEKLFGDKGVALSGFSYGSVSICFPVFTANMGWSYAVGVFDGSQWNALPTSITKQEETPNSWACSTVYANGTYALLKWWGNSNLSLQACGFDIGLYSLLGYPNYEDEDYFYFVITELGFRSRWDLSGEPVTIEFSGDFESPAVSGVLTYNGSDIYIFSNRIQVKVPKSGNINGIELNLKFDSCQANVQIKSN
jgi:hypothetical protein